MTSRFFCGSVIRVVIAVAISSNMVTLAQEDSGGANPVQVTVRDSAGNAIADVQAFWFHDGKAKRLSLADGALTIPSRDGLIVARKEGYQYSGLAFSKDNTDQSSIVMLAANEQGRELKTLPVPFDNETRKKIIATVVEDYWKRVEANPKDVMNVQRYLPMLAALDPEGTLEFLKSGIVDSNMEGLAKSSLIQSLAKTDPPAAMELADSVIDPSRRSGGFLKLLDNIPNDDAVRAAAESEMLEAATGITNPGLRLAILASIAEYYERTNQLELADSLVAKYIGEVEKLPSGGWSGYPRSLFAARIVNTDLERADRLAKIEHNETEQSRALGRLAFYCCKKHPDAALNFLNRIPRKKNAAASFIHEINVSQRMANSHPDAALSLAGSIADANQKAWALGLISLELHSDDSGKATQTLDQAIETLAAAEAELPSNFLSGAAVLAGLLPVAEKVAPAKVESMIWQSVWLAIPRSRWSTDGQANQSRVVNTAAAIARYDRSIALALLGNTKNEPGFLPDRAVVKQFAIDVNRLPELLWKIESDTRYSGGLHPHEKVAEMLTGNETGFWNAVSLPSFLTWGLDRFEDF